MRLFLYFFCLSLIALPARADLLPMPDEKPSLGQLEKNLKETENEKKLLAKQMKALESQLNDTKGELVGIAKSVQKNQSDLDKLENGIAGNEKKQAALLEDLEKDRAQIARLILALERIRRVPPEALIARPGAPLQAAQSAMLMGEIIPTLRKQAADTREKIDALKEVSAKLKNDRGKVVETAKSLQQEQDKLSTLVKKREELYSETSADYKEQEKSAQEIALQAKNLKDLLNKLDAEQRQRTASAAARPTPMPKAGSARLPVPGAIKVGYNETDALGAPSMGLSIETGENALVVAPFGGVVRFAGPFKRYGNMVIIEHAGGYHSLIAGLRKIDTVVGQSVGAGEPLGVMPADSNGAKPTLYYELRLDGQPVDPATKIAGLG